MIGALLVLSGGTVPVPAVDAFANTPAVAAAHAPQFAIAVPPLHDSSTHVRCILCGQAMCADHHLALPPSSEAVLPAEACLLLGSMMADLLPPARAPPAIASAVGASFDPRGPPSLS